MSRGCFLYPLGDIIHCTAGSRPNTSLKDWWWFCQALAAEKRKETCQEGQDLSQCVMEEVPVDIAPSSQYNDNSLTLKANVDRNMDNEMGDNTNRNMKRKLSETL